MTGSEFYKKLQPEYSGWLDSMDKCGCIASAYSIAFVKELMCCLDEIDADVPDDLDPKWFFEWSVDCSCECPVGEMFSDRQCDRDDFVRRHVETAVDQFRKLMEESGGEKE